ncbi:trigger factor [Microbispora sp. ATCC PTA-5024]|uniref:trigger factor n=1 Tax=Microbispora sp. ATCC PTA-5024 TaxID=316330 RepID=UPI0003DC1ED5|nr:trigger factor [Microbispora sp. ATCC PTA-5024]ETK37874.1 hypothetical protein MPTA5024_01855 [Microbispora sp. ATCC PTA-5024]
MTAGTTVETLGPARVRLDAAVPWAALQPVLQQTCTAASPGTTGLAGFRTGRLPFHPIDERTGAAALPRAVEAALLGLVATAAREHGLDPLGRFDVEIVDCGEGEPLRFAAVLDVRPEIAIPDLSSLVIRVDPVAVSEGEVRACLDGLRDHMATPEEADRLSGDEDGLRAALTERLYQAKGAARLRAARDEALRRLTEAAAVPAPEGLVGDEVEHRRQWMLAELHRLGTSLADQLAATGTTAEQLDADLVAATTQRVRSRLLLDAVADAERLSVSAAELAEAVARRGHAQVADVRRDKALTLVMRRVTFIDPAGTRVDEGRVR